MIKSSAVPTIFGRVFNQRRTTKIADRREPSFFSNMSVQHRNKLFSFVFSRTLKMKFNYRNVFKRLRPYFGTSAMPASNQCIGQVRTANGSIQLTYCGLCRIPEMSSCFLMLLEPDYQTSWGSFAFPSTPIRVIAGQFENACAKRVTGNA